MPKETETKKDTEYAKKAETETKHSPREANLEELRNAFSGPAVYCNRFYVNVGPGGVRIAFTEQIDEESQPIFRASVIMPIQDGISLRKLLEKLLADVEAQLEHAQKDGQ